MTSKPKVKCFIPARSGSTRLRNKNILPLHGAPLTTWSVIFALKSGCFDQIIVSTDSKDYFDLIYTAVENLVSDDYAEKLQKQTILDFRSPDFSGSKVKIFDYLKLGLSDQLFKDEDTLVQFLPTCPFRDMANFQKALSSHLVNRENIFSCVEYDFRIAFAFSIADHSNGVIPVFDPCPMVTGDTQSQAHQVHYHPCGSFNIVNMGHVRNRMATIYDGCTPWKVSRAESLDIDDLADFEFAERVSDRLLNFHD